MTFSDLATYTRELANLIGLRDWTVNLEVREHDDGETCATQEVAWGTQRVRISISPEWRMWKADDLRATLVHELVHCHMVRMMWTWNGAIRDLAKYKPLRKALDRAYHTDHEVATEAIATAWAELLPLPGEVGDEHDASAA